MALELRIAFKAVGTESVISHKSSRRQVRSVQLLICRFNALSITDVMMKTPSPPPAPWDRVS